MGDKTLDRLLVAEAGAEKRIMDAKERSRHILEKARGDASDQRETALQQFQQRRISDLSSVKEAALVEARSVREEGIREASDLETIAKPRIKGAVKSVIESYLGG